MAVNPTSTVSTYQLTGSAAGPFNTAWPYVDAADVKAFILVNGVKTDLAQVSQFTIAGPTPLTNGGQVTLAGGVIPGGGWPANSTLTLYRLTPNGQPSDFGVDLGFSPKAAEDALDNIARQFQEMVDSLSGALKSPAPGLPYDALSKQINHLAAGSSSGDAATYGQLLAAAAGFTVPVFTSVLAFANKTAAGLANIAGGTNQFLLLGYGAEGDCPPVWYFKVGSQPAHAGKVQSADGAWWEISTGATAIAEWFGAVDYSVDNSADNHTALSNFLAYCAGRCIGLVTGQYKTGSMLTVTTAKIKLVGIHGHSLIFGAFGYTMMKFSVANDVDLGDVEIRNDYVNAAFSGEGIVQTADEAPVVNMALRRVKISGAACNTPGLMVFANTGAMGSAGYIDGLLLDDCDIGNTGDLGVTFMNRSGDPTKAKGVKVRGGYYHDTGLIGSNGQAVSFDGTGLGAEYKGVRLENCLGIGIENTGWSYSFFEENIFARFTRTWAPFSFNKDAVAVQHCIVSRNVCAEGASDSPQFFDTNDCIFQANFWWVAGGSCMSLRDMQRCRFLGDTYKCAGGAPVFITSATGASIDNTWRDCHLDSSGGSGNAAFVFDQAATTGNRAFNCTYTFSSGNIAIQTNGAALNLVEVLKDGSTGRDYTAHVSFAMPDADTTVSGNPALFASGVLLLNGTLTAARKLTLLPHTWTRNTMVVINNTAEAITLVGPGGDGRQVPAGGLEPIVYRLDVQQFLKAA